MSRAARILPGPRCGGPEVCHATGAHSRAPGERRIWTAHDVQCPVPNPRPGPHLAGYPECSLVDLHAGDHDYVRHAAEVAEPEPEAEAEP
jgi:hypothetical protein